MPRPKTKPELLDLSQKNFNKLMDFVESFDKSEQDRDFPPGTLNRNIRDVLAHLHHWHNMMMAWYRIGMKGEKPEMPAPGYTWRTTPDLNIEIQKQWSTTDLGKVKELFTASHAQVMAVIESHTNEELFTKKKYPWTGSTSLGAYLVSSTSSHYDWAYKLIKRCKK